MDRPKCGCAEFDGVRTCPECIGYALRFGPLAEALAQLELFPEFDTKVSLRGSIEVEIVPGAY